MSKTRCKEKGLDGYFNFHLLAVFECEKCGSKANDKKYLCKPTKIKQEKLSLNKNKDL